MATLTLDAERMSGLCNGRDITLDSSAKKSMAASVNAVVNDAEIRQKLAAFAKGAPLTNLTIIVRQDGSISARTADGRLLPLASRTDAVAKSFEPIRRNFFTPPAPMAPPAMPFMPPQTSMVPPPYPQAPMPMGPPPMPFMPPQAPIVSPSYPQAPMPMGSPAYPFTLSPAQHFPQASMFHPPASFEAPADISITAPLKETLTTPDKRDEQLRRQSAALKEAQERAYDIETEKLVVQNELLDLTITPLQTQLDKINEEIASYSLPERDDEDDFGNADTPQPSGVMAAITVPFKNIIPSYRQRYRELLQLRAQKEQAIKSLVLEQEFNIILMSSTLRDRKTRQAILELTVQDKDLEKKLMSAAPTTRQTLLESRIEVVRQLINHLKLLEREDREGLESPSIQELHDQIKLIKVFTELSRELAAVKGTPAPAERPHYILPPANLKADKAALEAAFKAKLGAEDPKMVFKSPTNRADYDHLTEILTKLHKVEMELLDATTI